MMMKKDEGGLAISVYLLTMPLPRIFASVFLMTFHGVFWGQSINSGLDATSFKSLWWEQSKIHEAMDLALLVLLGVGLLTNAVKLHTMYGILGG